MQFSTQTKCILLVGGFLLLIYFISRKTAYHNDGSLESPVQVVEGMSDEEYQSRMRTKDSAVDGEYKRSNYIEGKRGNSDMNMMDDFFENGTTSHLAQNHPTNDAFGPHDIVTEQYAGYKPGQKPPSDEDMYDITNYQPKEQKSDWFDILPEPVSVKNRHLINVTRPIGVNTISSTLKNPSYDIRGTPPCPKYTASPWNQSSIEPDTNMKSLC